MKSRRLAVGLLLCVTVEAAAQTASIEPATAVAASEYFAAGSRAFEAQDYLRALSEFEAAIRAGSDGPAVHYNVAVCHYQLGDYALAEEAFRSLGRRFPEMRYLADYNLGLALTRRNRTAEARAAFERALGADDDRIVSLATAMLARLPSPARDSAPAAWTRLVDFRVGHDGNVALLDASSLPAGRSTDSGFAELLAYAGGPLTTSGRWRLDASAYLVEYPDASELDQSGVYLGARYEWRARNWRLLAGPQLGRSALDGDGFEQHAGVTLDLRHTFAPARAVLGIVLTHDEVDAVEPQFGFVEGERDQLTLLLERALGSGRVVLDYRFERNDRAGAGVSSDRDRYSLRYRWALRPDWTGEVMYEYRLSDYARLDVPREERRHQAGFQATRRFGSSWQMTIQYRYTNNESSDPVFSYERHRIGVGASKTFF